MTIDDQIRDQKLPYDINSKAAEMSALSSGKINKYEYVTGNKILPSNQQQMIEQAKFTYSPLGKAFEKQIKTIEKVNRDDLVYRYKGKTPDEKFDEYDNALNLIDKIKNGEIKLAEAKNDQIRFKSNLGEIKKGNNKKRSKEQKNALYNIDMLYKARNEAIKFYDDYSLMVSEAKNKAKSEGKGLKILTPKQLLQRLPIALAQVKAGNNSENFLNEVR